MADAPEDVGVNSSCIDSIDKAIAKCSYSQLIIWVRNDEVRNNDRNKNTTKILFTDFEIRDQEPEPPLGYSSSRTIPTIPV